MSRPLETLVIRDAIGWALFCWGVLWLVGGGEPPEATGPESESGGYLAGVLSRSLAGPYERALLAGLLSVPLHAGWTWWRRRRDAGVAVAYDSFGLWAQTVFTSLGFLGTVVGVSLAVAGLEDAMKAGDPGALVGGLFTAFDTTFLGLSAAILLMAFRKAARPSAGA